MQTFTFPLTDALFPSQPAGELSIIFDSEQILSVKHNKIVLPLEMLQSSLFTEAWYQISEATKGHRNYLIESHNQEELS